MVIKFTSNVVDPPALLYMGVDKYENEELIKYGWPEDVWFHVDKVSSAHVYLRLPEGMTIDTIPQALIDDCCQLVKANSIDGNKMTDVGIVYTMWENLKKTGDMAVGQIGFHDNKKVKRCVVQKRINEIVNRLNKTEKKEDIDYRAEREQRDMAVRRLQRKLEQEKKALEMKEAEEREALRRQRHYEDVDWNAKRDSDDGNLSDDFM
ncbi:Coiled-coil domain-containing protein 25 [Parelaphostrongylus tenuis]|uniref:Coiled-coil domain-containing protein 25 n=1 Tax=Parelaphostrongylus tenuis TaxID=148309 RepID=A0AAD5WJX4_PARTN|nr:Coiled-coil domain-containing protein 25 [Parelaphostrongylus tenuis]